VATKALPEIVATSALLAPLLQPSYKFAQPVYVLLQNGMGIEKDLYSAAVKLDKGTPQILHGATWIGANLVAPNVLVHGDFVSPCTQSLPYSFIFSKIAGQNVTWDISSTL
jgi:2-dehydropantoate 2-reductase